MQGLLWFDDTPNRPTAEIVARAAARYETKYSAQPSAVYIHPSSAPDQTEIQIAPGKTVRVIQRTSILQHHFWIV